MVYSPSSYPAVVRGVIPAITYGQIEGDDAGRTSFDSQIITIDINKFSNGQNFVTGTMRHEFLHAQDIEGLGPVGNIVNSMIANRHDEITRIGYGIRSGTYSGDLCR